MALDKSTLGAVRSGVGTSYGGCCVMAAVVAATILLALGMDLSPLSMRDVPRLARLLIAGLSIGLLMGGLIDLLGRLRCLAVPLDFFGRPALVGSIILLVFGLSPFVWRAICAVTSFTPMPIPLHRGLEVALAASPLVFLVFLREVARAIDRHDHDEQLGQVQTAGLVLVIAFILLRVLDLAMARTDPIAPGSLFLLDLIGYTLIEIGAIFTFVLYSKYLVEFREAIREAMSADPAQSGSGSETLWSAPPIKDIIPAVRGPLDLDAGLPPPSEPRA